MLACPGPIRSLAAGLALLATSMLAALPASAQRPAAGGEQAATRADERLALVEEVRQQIAATGHETGVEALSQPVIDAMATVPREAFLPEELRPYAYSNQPLPVGHGQTISQPFIVALMIELAQVRAQDRVLVVGMGGGYMAGLLSRIVAEVHGIEFMEPVAQDAMARMLALDFANIRVKVADSYYGWPDQAPFDAIIVRQAVDHVPSPFINQLADDGRLIMPLGPREGPQHLIVARPDGEAGHTRRRVTPVRFTMLPGGERI